MTAALLSPSPLTVRSLVLHVCLPGQDLEAEDMTGPFPSLADLGMNLVTVLDQLRISRVVLLGLGAGANIAARFAMNHPGRVEGMLLVDCKHSVASFPLKLKVKVEETRAVCDRCSCRF